MKIINAEGAVLGRLASLVAKHLMNDEEVKVVNAEKAIVIGSKDMIVEDFLSKRRLSHARKGPHYPRRADMILKRTVRGMIPYQKPSGREAYKKLRVYLGVPSEFEGKAEKIGKIEKTPVSFMTLESISKNLGG
jgi:large subunit ribosomal protein L13